jgi:hypothetical protein
MHTLEGLPMLEHYNSLLKKSDKESAWRVVHEYFRIFEDKDPQELLWFMLTTALRADNEEIGARQRGDLIFFYEYSVLFLKAVNFLHQDHENSKKRKKGTG